MQEIVYTFLYYTRAIDGTLLVALSSIGASIGLGNFQQIKQNIIQFLNYVSTRSDTKIVYYASEMHLWAHSDTSYLSESRARSWVGGGVCILIA